MAAIKRECGNDGGRNRHRSDQRGANVGQENENDDGGQKAAFDQVRFESRRRRLLMKID